MNDQTQNIVDPFFLTQCPVSTLVSQFPQAGEEETLGEGVSYPGQIARDRVRKVRDCRPGKKSQSGNKKEIPKDVRDGKERAGLETVWWNRIVDILHCVLRRSEDRRISSSAIRLLGRSLLGLLHIWLEMEMVDGFKGGKSLSYVEDISTRDEYLLERQDRTYLATLISSLALFELIP